jgi:hypothetical protein
MARTVTETGYTGNRGCRTGSGWDFKPSLVQQDVKNTIRLIAWVLKCTCAFLGALWDLSFTTTSRSWCYRRCLLPKTEHDLFIWTASTTLVSHNKSADLISTYYSLLTINLPASWRPPERGSGKWGKHGLAWSSRREAVQTFQTPNRRPPTHTELVCSLKDSNTVKCDSCVVHFSDVALWSYHGWVILNPLKFHSMHFFW